jgi:hypothetical protein
LEEEELALSVTSKIKYQQSSLVTRQSMGTRLKPLEDAVQKSAVGDAKVAAPTDMIHPDHAATHAHPLRTRLVPAKPSSFQLFSVSAFTSSAFPAA